MKKKENKKRIAIVLVISIILSMMPVFPVSAEVFHNVVTRPANNPNEEKHTKPRLPGETTAPTEAPLQGYTLLNDGTYKLMYDNNTEETITVSDTYNRKDVTVIGDNAYTGNTTVKQITVPRKITSVGSFAFSGCTALQTVVIQNADTEIGTGAFEGCGNVTIKCPGHSAAENYAIVNNIPYQIFDINDARIYINDYGYGVAWVDIWASDGVKLEEDVDYTFTYTVDWDKMTSFLKIEGIGQYSGSYSETGELKAKYDIKYQTIDLEQSSYVYDGTAKKPKVTVYTYCQNEGDLVPDAGPLFPDTGDDDDYLPPRLSAPVGGGYYKYLTEGEDYTVEYVNNIDAGTASVIVTGKRLYMGTVVKNFTIANTSISSASVTLSSNSYTYDGTEKKPEVTVKLGSKTLVENTDYTLRYANNTAAGVASAVVEGKGSYAETVIKQFIINKRNLNTLGARVSESTFTYDGTEKTPDLIITCGSFTLVNGKDYTLSYTDNNAVGTATVTATGKGNFTGTVSKSFTIKQNIRSVTDCTVTLSSESFTYDGTYKEPAVTVKYGTAVLTSSDYSVSYAQNKNAGTASVTVTGKGNYTGTVVKRFTINPKALTSGMLTNNTGTKTYDGYEKYPDFTLTDNGNSLRLNTDYTVSYSNNLNAGKAKASITGKGNYKGSLSLEYTISPYPFSENSLIMLSPIKYEYDGTPKEPAVTARVLSRYLEQGKDFTVSYSNNTQVGTGYAVVQGIGNYTGSVSKPFTITGKQISNSINVALSATSYTYDGANHKPTVTVTYTPDGSANAVTLRSGTDYDVTYDADCKSVGTHNVTVKCKNNYSGIKTVTYTIEKRHISSTQITLSQTAYTYDGTAKKPAVTVKLGSTALKEGTDYTVSYRDNVKVGTAQVIVKGINNFYDEKIAKFTISKELTPFTWGVDNWNFDNADLTTYAVDDKVKTQLVKDLQIKFSDLESIEQDLSMWKSWEYGGSCYGFTSTEMLVKQGSLTLSRYQANNNVSLDDITHNNTLNESSQSVINFFQALQNNTGANQALRRDCYINKYESQQYLAISFLESKLKNNDSMVNLCFEGFARFTKNGINYKIGDTTHDFGHSVLAYGVEKLKQPISVPDITGNKIYDKRILIADPNALSLNKVYDYSCVYYNSTDHSWVIPTTMYNNKGEYNNADLVTYWDAEDYDINNPTGLISGLYVYESPVLVNSLMSDKTVNQYIAGLEIESNNHSLNVGQLASSGNKKLCYNGMNGNSDVKQYNIYSGNKEDEDLKHFALYNPTADYGINYSSISDYVAMMDYENVVYDVDMKNSKSMDFYSKGMVYSEGENMQYTLSMITDEELCVTDWYKITASGDNVNRVSLQKTEGGYILTADNLNNVSVSAKNLDTEVSCRFSANAQSAYIYEINRHTIGIKLDVDGDGSFETELTTDVVRIGDLNGDGKVNIRDVTVLQRHVAELAYLSENQRALADVNNDGRVDILDATHLQTHLAEFGAVLG